MDNPPIAVYPFGERWFAFDRRWADMRESAHGACSLPGLATARDLRLAAAPQGVRSTVIVLPFEAGGCRHACMWHAFEACN